VTNSVRRSGSAMAGGVVTVAVIGRSGGGTPMLRPAAFTDGDAGAARGGTQGYLRRRMGLLAGWSSPRRGSSLRRRETCSPAPACPCLCLGSTSR
jgi:hypothetical protein